MYNILFVSNYPENTVYRASGGVRRLQKRNLALIIRVSIIITYVFSINKIQTSCITIKLHAIKTRKNLEKLELY